MRGVENLIKDSFEEYKTKFVSFAKAFLILYFIPLILGLIILVVIVTSSIYSGSGEGDVNVTSFFSNPVEHIDFSMGIPIITGVSIVALIIGIFLVFMSISFILISLSKKKEIKFKEIFKESKKYFWKFLGLGILIGISLSLLYCMLIIPGIIFTVFWIFAPFILIKENKKIIESMKKSFEMVKGQWWKIFLIYFILMVMAVIVSAILSFVPVLSMFSTLIVTPFVIIFLKNMYEDMKKKK